MARSASSTSGADPRWRIMLAIGALFGGIVVTILVAGTIIGLGGWDTDVSSSSGADVGRVVGRAGADADLDHNRVPLVVLVAANSPLWATFVGVPLWARRRGLDWRRDLRWSMRPIDAPLGIGLGVLTQLVLVPLLYIPILDRVDGDELERPARELIAGATTPVAVVALVVFTVIAAPVCEEILFRGVLFHGILEMEDANRLALPVAVLVSSAIFAVSHLQLLQFPGLLLIGAVAALAVYRTGRLATAIWAHAAFNATTVAILLPDIY